jgi:hypothetical protein
LATISASLPILSPATGSTIASLALPFPGSAIPIEFSMNASAGVSWAIGTPVNRVSSQPEGHFRILLKFFVSNIF